MRLLIGLLIATGLHAQGGARNLLVSLTDAPATPTDSPGAGTYGSTQSVTLSDATAAAILYTIDGSTPACPATGTLYTGAISVAVTTTIKAIGCNGVTGGGVLTSVYTITATVTLNAGFSFRSTLGFVTDAAGDQFVGGAASCPSTYCYPVTTTIGGISTVYGWNPSHFEAGWVASATGAATGIDRNASVGDARLAGIAGIGGDSTSFGVVLPSSGSYDLIFALGDANSGQGPMTIQIYDGAALLSTIVSAGSTGATQWFDASGTLRTSQAAWTSTGATTVATVTTTGTKLGVKLNGATGSAYMAYFHITNH